MASLTARVDELSAVLRAREREAADGAALGARHAAALELIGEQEEELDALRADLADVTREWQRQVQEWCPPAPAPTETPRGRGPPDADADAACRGNGVEARASRSVGLQPAAVGVT